MDLSGIPPWYGMVVSTSMWWWYLQLRVAALNSPQSGNMDGINGVNYACYMEVRVFFIIKYTFQCEHCLTTFTLQYEIFWNFLLFPMSNLFLIKSNGRISPDKFVSIVQMAGPTYEVFSCESFAFFLDADQIMGLYTRNYFKFNFIASIWYLFLSILVLYSPIPALHFSTFQFIYFKFRLVGQD